MVCTLFSKKLRLRNFFTIFSFFKLWNKAIENILFYLELTLYMNVRRPSTRKTRLKDFSPLAQAFDVMIIKALEG